MSKKNWIQVRQVYSSPACYDVLRGCSSLGFTLSSFNRSTSMVLTVHRLVLNARPVNSTPVYHDSRSLTYKSWTTAETDSSMNNTSWTAHFPCIRDFTQVWSSYNIYRYTLFIENFSNTMCAIRGMRYCMKFLFISITKLHVIPICSCPQCLFVCLFT